MNRSLPVVLCVLGLTGCGKVTKVKECNALIETVNAGVKRIEALGSAKQGGASQVTANLRKLADAYEQVGADAGKVEVTTPELKSDVADYQSFAKGEAAALRTMAIAVETGDTAKSKAAEADFDQLSKKEDALIQKMNGFCHE